MKKTSAHPAGDRLIEGAAVAVPTPVWVKKKAEKRPISESRLDRRHIFGRGGEKARLKKERNKSHGHVCLRKETPARPAEITHQSGGAMKGA